MEGRKNRGLWILWHLTSSQVYPFILRNLHPFTLPTSKCQHLHFMWGLSLAMKPDLSRHLCGRIEVPRNEPHLEGAIFQKYWGVVYKYPSSLAFRWKNPEACVLHYLRRISQWDQVLLNQHGDGLDNTLLVPYLPFPVSLPHFPTELPSSPKETICTRIRVSTSSG